MQPFAILAAIADGLIPEEYQRELFDVDDTVDAWGDVMMQVSLDDADED